MQDLLAKLDVGGLDVGHQAHRQARKEARFHTIERLRCAVGCKDQALAFVQQRIDRVEQFFLSGSLADDELDIVHQQQVEAAEAGLEFDHPVGLQGLDEFHHEAFRAAVEDAAAGVGLQEGVTDGVQQVRLALAGRGLEVERAELRLFRRSHALCGVEGEDVRFAGHESGEAERCVEADAGSEALVAERIGADSHHRGIAVVGGAAAIAMQTQVGNLAAAGVNRDVHLAHFAAGDLPGQAEAVGEPVLHPVGAEFRRQEKVERACFGIDFPDLDRLDPLAVQLMTEILAQPLADVSPIGCQVYCLQILHIVFRFPLIGEVTRFDHVNSTPRNRTRPKAGKFCSCRRGGTAPPLPGIA